MYVRLATFASLLFACTPVRTPSSSPDSALLVTDRQASIAARFPEERWGL